MEWFIGFCVLMLGVIAGAFIVGVLSEFKDTKRPKNDRKK